MIKIICVGKVKEKYLREAIADYQKRISRYHKIDIIEVEDSNMKEEAERINHYIKSNDYVITLEIDGNMITSLSFAEKINRTFIINSNITFVIGGSLGLSNEVRERANFKLKLSEISTTTRNCCGRKAVHLNDRH